MLIKKKPDNGKLPLDVPEPQLFLADPSHRKKVYGKYVYKIAKDTKVKGFTINDAKNLKDNFGYAQSQHTADEMPTFQTRFVAAIEHIFNKHDNCDSAWCKYHNNHQLTESEGKKKYKDVSYSCYPILRDIHDKLTSVEKLKQIHHQYNTQKNESMNRAIAKQAPKNVTFCKSLSLKGRVSFVVSVSAIGYEATVERLCTKLNIDFPESIRSAWRDVDKRKIYKRNYDKRKKVKRRRTRTAKENMKKQRLEENSSKKEGYYYGAGVALLDDIVNDDTHMVPVLKKQRTKSDPKNGNLLCVCGASDHRRQSSHKCRLWKEKNKIHTETCVEITPVMTLCTNIQQLGKNPEM